jgi:hypothetical protein
MMAKHRAQNQKHQIAITVADAILMAISISVTLGPM